MPVANSSSRNAILNRLRSDQHPTESKKPSLPMINSHSRENGSDQIEQFTAKLLENRIEVLLSSQEDWPQDLLHFSRENRLNSWLVGERKEALRFQKTLAYENNTNVTIYRQNYEQLREQLFSEIEASLSFANTGIVSTGSLVLQSSPEEPRMLSLVAPISVIICDISTLVSDLNEYMKHLDRNCLINSSNTIIVSSPSKTADIQQQLAYGAHGPKRVVALLI